MNEKIQSYILPTNFQQMPTLNQPVQTGAGLDFQQLLLEKMALAQSWNLQGGYTEDFPSLEPFSMMTGMTQTPNMFATMMNNPVSAVFSPQVPMNEAIQSYSNTQQQTISGAAKQAPTTQYNGIISQAAQKYGVDENLIHAIIKMESNYNPNVRSHAGAVGLMQLMPVTAKEVGVTDRTNIQQNIDGGTHYFSKMLKRHNGDVKLALASYNAGPGNVQKYGGIPPFKETQNYVRKVMDYYKA